MEKKDIKEYIDNLKQQRDELNVKIHLATADAKVEWGKLEEKWGHFEAKTKQVGGEAKEASKEVWGAVKQLGSELKEGYDRIRKTL